MISLQKQIFWIGRVQVVTAVTVVAGVVGSYVFLYRPASAQKHEAAGQVASLEAELARNNEVARDLPAIEREVNRLHEQITRSRRLPAQQELPQFIRDITRLSQDNRLDQFRYEPDAEHQLALCYEMPVTMMFEGNFADVASFIRQAEQMSRLTRTRKVHIKAKDSAAGLVTADLGMNIYFGGAK